MAEGKGIGELLKEVPGAVKTTLENVDGKNLKKVAEGAGAAAVGAAIVRGGRALSRELRYARDKDQVKKGGEWGKTTFERKKREADKKADKKAESVRRRNLGLVKRG